MEKQNNNIQEIALHKEEKRGIYVILILFLISWGMIGLFIWKGLSLYTWLIIGWITMGLIGLSLWRIIEGLLERTKKEVFSNG